MALIVIEAALVTSLIILLSQQDLMILDDMYHECVTATNLISQIPRLVKPNGSLA